MGKSLALVCHYVKASLPLYLSKYMLPIILKTQWLDSYALSLLKFKHIFKSYVLVKSIFLWSSRLDPQEHR